MLIESVKRYIESLDCMQDFNKAININYLAEDVENFSIEESPNSPILKRYSNGSTVRAYEFAFSSREIYGVEMIQNLENAHFYEKLVNEIEKKDSIGILPILDTGLESQSIEVTSSPYIISTDENTGIYQVSLRLKYYKEA